jgi:hypothetical protein
MHVEASDGTINSHSSSCASSIEAHGPGDQVLTARWWWYPPADMNSAPLDASSRPAANEALDVQWVCRHRQFEVATRQVSRGRSA